MKKIKTFLPFLLLLCGTTVLGQSFAKGTKTVNIGLGYGYGGPGILGSAEVGIAKDISAGIVAGLSRRSYGYFGDNWGVTYIVLGARGSYHLGKLLQQADVKIDKLDPYIGVTGGFRSVKYSDSWAGYDGRGTGLMIGGYLGCRYQFKDKLGFVIEGGSPFSTLGITFKF